MKNIILLKKKRVKKSKILILISISFVFFLSSCNGKKNQFNINVYQNGETIIGDKDHLSLNKNKFSFIFSFYDIPKEADTSLYIYYVATPDSSIMSFSQLNSSKEVFYNMVGDSIPSWVLGGAVGKYNDDEEIFSTDNIKSGKHNILYIEKIGSENKVSHSFNNVDRTGDDLSAWYSVKKIHDTEIESLKKSQKDLYIFFSNPDLNKKGKFFHLDFNKE